MLQKSIIRTLWASLLLLIFTFSATPKIFLHDLIVNHKDSPSPSRGDMDQVNTAGFHCNCENLVVELPYFYNPVYIQQVVIEAFPAYQINTEHRCYSTQHFIFGFRGPPVNGSLI